MKRNSFKKFVSISCLISMIFILASCDLYDAESREGITMNNISEDDEERPVFLDGKNPDEETNNEEANNEEADSEEANSDESDSKEVDNEALNSQEADKQTEATDEDKTEEVDSEDKTEATESEITNESEEQSETVGNAEIATEEANKISEENIEKSRVLNSDGFSLYQSGNYEEALEKFKMSFTYDPSYFYGHFNYACTLGVLMKEDYPSWYESKGEVIEHLKICLELDPDSKVKIMNDSDLDPVKSEMEYLQEIAGYNIMTSDGALNILKQSNWYVHGSGVISVLGEVNFSANKVTFSYLNLENFNEGTIGEPIILNGTYSFDGSVITFKMDAPGLRRRSLSDVYNNYDVIDDRVEFTGTLSSEGVLSIDGFEYQYYSWYDEFSA